MTEARRILRILDEATEAFVFPMLDNGYVYLAASRMHLFAGSQGWAIVFEVFGYSPRAGYPDIQLTTIGEPLVCRRQRTDFVSSEAYQAYVDRNRYWEQRNTFPLSGDDWIVDDESGAVAPNGSLFVREQEVRLPPREAYAGAGVPLAKDGSTITDVCRYLAATQRDSVLSSAAEVAHNVGRGVDRLLVLDDWMHPDLASGELPSQSATFRAVAATLAAADASRYEPASEPNTHWRNWPDGGTL